VVRPDRSRRLIIKFHAKDPRSWSRGHRRRGADESGTARARSRRGVTSRCPRRPRERVPSRPWPAAKAWRGRALAALIWW